MAKISEDYEVVTAQESAAAQGPITEVIEANAKAAEEAGVIDAAYVDYAHALENYESRPDVETLAARRAREAGTSFSDADFRREIGAVEDTGVISTDTAVNYGDENQEKSAVDADVNKGVETNSEESEGQVKASKKAAGDEKKAAKK